MKFEQYYEDLLSPKKNTKFSSLRGNDLKELLYLVNNYKIFFRERLLFDYKLKFGCEIEYEKVLRFFVTKFIRKNFWRWDSKKDFTCNLGGEVTTPVFGNKKQDWIELKKVCEYLESKGADMLHNASCHIHTDKESIDEISYNRQFLKLIGCYESVLFRFGYGDKISGRKNIKKYAYPVADLIFEALDEINTYEIKYMSFPQNDKYYAINYLTGDKHTIEFRLFNATKYPQIIQNNVNTVINTITAPKRGLIDEEYLDYKLQNEFISPTLQWHKYNEILLKNSLEFVDFVYSNNLDKIFFLVQYFKRCQNNFGAKEAIEAKCFVR